MKRSWRDYVALQGGIEGARSAFESDCMLLLRKMYPDRKVDTVKADPGDEGVDIYVGNLGQEDVKIYQCKFFLDEFEEPQKSQIRLSFQTAINSTSFKMSDWRLLVPYAELNISQALWFSEWKRKQIVKFDLDSNFIDIINGNDLINLMHEHHIYNKVFQISEALALIETNQLVKDIHDVVLPKKKVFSETFTSENRKEIISEIFNVQYSQEYEKFYIVRSVDEEILTSLNYHKNIWVHGSSGMGKTTSITRTLKLQAKEFHYTYLTSIVSPQNAMSLLENIIIDVAEIYLEREISLSTGENLIKKLVSILNEFIKTEEVIFYIDEISVANEEVFSVFVNHIVAFSQHYNISNNGKRNVKFILSTIQNPTKFCSNESKAIESIHFIELEDWDNEELNVLLDKISSALLLNVSGDDTKSIIKASKSSPRILKEIFYKKVTYPQMSFDQLINRL